jgi:hypothetical protein
MRDTNRRGFLGCIVGCLSGLTLGGKVKLPEVEQSKQKAPQSAYDPDGDILVLDGSWVGETHVNSLAIAPMVNFLFRMNEKTGGAMLRLLMGREEGRKGWWIRGREENNHPIWDEKHGRNWFLVMTHYYLSKDWYKKNYPGWSFVDFGHIHIGISDQNDKTDGLIIRQIDRIQKVVKYHKEHPQGKKIFEHLREEREKYHFLSDIALRRNIILENAIEGREEETTRLMIDAGKTRDLIGGGIV